MLLASIFLSASCAPLARIGGIFALKGLLTVSTIGTTMAKKEKAPEMRFQCLNCYKTHKQEQKALDCCGSFIQAWTINYNKWGQRQKWYGR